MKIIFLLYMVFIFLSCSGDKKRGEDKIGGEILYKDIIFEDTLDNDELNIFDEKLNLSISIGDKLDTFIKNYPINNIENKPYSNMVFKKMVSDSIVFFVSNYPEMNNDNVDFSRNLLLMEIYGTKIFTKRGIAIGDNKDKVVKIYGQPNSTVNKLYGNNINIKEAYIYYNRQNDVREILFGFNDEDIVNIITLSAGD